jgi:hypothetical protein
MNAAATTTPNTAPVPIVSAAAMRRLPVWAAGSLVVVAVISAVTALLVGNADWWPALAAAFVIALLSAAASIVVLGKVAGRTVDWLVTLTMAATVARMGVSGIGFLIASKLLHVAADVAGLWLCGYYAAMLVAETALLMRIAQQQPAQAVAANVVGDSHA